MTCFRKNLMVVCEVIVEASKISASDRYHPSAHQANNLVHILRHLDSNWASFLYSVSDEKFCSVPKRNFTNYGNLYISTTTSCVDDVQVLHMSMIMLIVNDGEENCWSHWLWRWSWPMAAHHEESGKYDNDDWGSANNGALNDQASCNRRLRLLIITFCYARPIRPIKSADWGWGADFTLGIYKFTIDQRRLLDCIFSLIKG